MGKPMLVGKEVRKDLAAAQRELDDLDEALSTATIDAMRSRIRIAKAHIAEAMRRLG